MSKHKTEMLAMREQGMSNVDIAQSIGCCVATVYNLIGKQPPEMSRANRYAARMESEIPKCSALVVKPTEPQPINLHGTFMDYHIPADRTRIDVETPEKRCLMQIPAEMLDTLIEELEAIRRNIDSEQVLPFWG